MESYKQGATGRVGPRARSSPRAPMGRRRPTELSVWDVPAVTTAFEATSLKTTHLRPLFSWLLRHPDVQAAAIVAKPDAKWGEVPCAFVELRPGATADAQDIVTFCRCHLAGFKTPKSVIFADLPKTATGKIQKFVLRARAQSDAQSEG